MKTLLLTAVALICFAGNSVLVRLALADGVAAPGGFALIRILSGALFLFTLIAIQQKRLNIGPVVGGHWRSALALFSYVAFFSFAYLNLDAGAGALVLFASVQFTMLGAGLIDGERLSALQWAGVAAAVVGLIAFLSPAVAQPDPVAVAAMITAGISWGFYSLYGRSAVDALGATAGNFIRASVIAVILALLLIMVRPEPWPQGKGVALAVASGVVTSGFGYAVWYAALPKLTAIHAGVSQLTVPVIAAFGGLVLIGEPITLPSVMSGSVVLLGVGIATLTRCKP